MWLLFWKVWSFPSESAWMKTAWQKAKWQHPEYTGLFITTAQLAAQMLHSLWPSKIIHLELSSLRSRVRDSNRVCALLARMPWVPPLPAAASPGILTPSVPQLQGAEVFSPPFIPRWSSKGCHSGVCRLPMFLLVHRMNTSHPHVVVDNTLWRPLPSPFRSYSAP